MKNLCSFIILACYLSVAQSQQSSLNTPIGGRIVSLADASVAFATNPLAFDENPALLSMVQSLILFYDSRPLDLTPFSSGHSMLSYGAATRLPFGAAAFSYRRFEKGELFVSGPSGPEIIGVELLRDYTYVFSFATEIIPSIHVGVSAKVFETGFEHRTGIGLDVSTVSAYGADIGILYHLPSPFMDRFITDDSRSCTSRIRIGP